MSLLILSKMKLLHSQLTVSVIKVNTRDDTRATPSTVIVYITMECVLTMSRKVGVT